ncbi:hypothetical protein SynSYN20_02955 [Synechococcus sp. SYN20]|nr:hypothetical protein SynSYN20_02955 [Synechococcus sp. SYN20]
MLQVPHHPLLQALPCGVFYWVRSIPRCNKTPLAAGNWWTVESVQSAGMN